MIGYCIGFFLIILGFIVMIAPICSNLENEKAKLTLKERVAILEVKVAYLEKELTGTK